MKVLEDLTAKVIQTGQKVSDKVKDVNDTVGLNNEISQLESQIQGLYAEAGRCIIDQEHLKNFSSVSDLELQAKLKDFGSQISDLKMQLGVLLDRRCKKTGKGICKVCGSEISREDRYCPKCGAHSIIIKEA